MNALFIFDLMIALIIVSVTLYLINPKIFELYEEEPCLYDPVVEKLKAKVERFFDARTTPWTGHLEILNNKKKNVLKKLKLCKGTSSYTIDKETTYICTKDPKTDKYYDDNMLMHVLLHELSHVISTEVGHTKTFDDIFQQLMKEAHAFGIYDETLPLISNYCGTTSADTYTI
jgi:hypothetical protein